MPCGYRDLAGPVAAPASTLSTSKTPCAHAFMLFNDVSHYQDQPLARREEPVEAVGAGLGEVPLRGERLVEAQIELTLRQAGPEGELQAHRRPVGGVVSEGLHRHDANHRAH